MKNVSRGRGHHTVGSDVERPDLLLLDSQLAGELLFETPQPLLELLSNGTMQLKYASMCNGGVIDAHKGRPPTKRERDQDVVDDSYDLYYMWVWHVET